MNVLLDIHSLLEDAVLAAVLVLLFYASVRLYPALPARIFPRLPSPSAIVVTGTLAAALLPVG
jgi:hypothetical protein